MPLNASDSYNQALELFSSLYQDMFATDLPAGLSPDNQDVWYLPGQVGTRPALNKALATPPEADLDTVSLAEFALPSGRFLTLWMYSDGTLWQQDTESLAVTQIPAILSAGSQFRSVTAFDKQFFAFYNQALTNAFTDSPFAGCDVPRYLDQNGDLWRVTQDAPAIAPTVADFFQTAAIANGNLLGVANGTITAASQTGNLVTITTIGPHGLAPGQNIAVVGVGVSGYNGFQTIIGTPSADSYTYNISATGLAASSGGNTYFAIYVFNLSSSVKGVNIGDSVVISDVSAGGGAFNPNNLVDGNPAYWTITAVATSQFRVSVAGSTQVPTSDVLSTGGAVNFGGQSTAGVHEGVCIFASSNGALTAPSVPVSFVSVGNSQWQVTGIPIGPPGTAQRILAFTPAGGSSYFYLAPSVVPATADQPAVISQGTIINDNTSVSAFISFSDAALTAGIEIDIQGNDLFNQIVLAPCLGCIEYEGRMAWWGEINDVKNLINNHFDGGYTPLSGTVTTLGINVTQTSGAEFLPGMVGFPIVINGVVYTIASYVSPTAITLTASAGTQPSDVPFYVLAPQYSTPLGWSANHALLVAQSDPSLGFACALTATNLSNVAYISQPCYQDYYGGPILEPLIPYIFRCLAGFSFTGAFTSAVINVIISSATKGTLAQAVTIIGTQNQQWITIGLPALPATIPSDAVLTIELQATFSGAGTATLVIDEIEMIDATQPVLFQQMRLSYFANEFGYDEETGILGLDGQAKITAAFKQRSYLYALTDGPLYQTQNNGQTEPDDWSFTAFADECDCWGPNAVATTEDIAWWAGLTGWKVFSGSQPKKISQEIQPTWESINDNAPTSVWAVNDPVERITYLGVAVNGAAKPNLVLPMSYRAVDAAYNVPDPIHTSYSGKLIATDLCRKWTRWNMTMSCGAILTRPGLQKQMFFGGQQFSNFYSLNFGLFTDDDYGQIFSYYTTYFFFNHDIEQNAPGLGLHQKIYAYLTAYITGVGTIQPTALANNLNNPWGTIAAMWDPINQKWINAGSAENPFAAVPLTQGVLKNDLEWGLNIKNVARVAIKWAPSPLSSGSSPSPLTDAAFVLTHMVLSCREDKVSPVRGSNVSG